MQATPPDAFALRNSRLDAFLYADVGTELNGSTLTILSILARLGRDPWAEAARWAKLPKAAVIDSLAQSIAQMPLAPSALAETRATAARLILLLPSKTQSRRQNTNAVADSSAAPGWLFITTVYCAVFLGMCGELLQPGAGRRVCVQSP